MANRTVKDAHSIHGTNPQYLIEKIIRTRIYDSKYWKEECFALSAELLVDKAMNLRYIAGVYGGNVKPSPFLCLTLKMLQIQPEKDIIIEFIKQDEFKYVRALGSYYLRLVYPSLDCHKYLAPLLNDYRKLRVMDRNGIFKLTYVDQFIDDLLREDRVSDVVLPRIQKRWVHEANNELEPRVSLLEDDLEDLESESEDEDVQPASTPPPLPPKRSRHSPSSRDRRRHSVSPDEKRRKSRRSDRDRRGRDDYGQYKDHHEEVSSRHHRSDREGERMHRDRDEYREEYREDHRERRRDEGRSHREHKSDRREKERRSDGRSKREGRSRKDDVSAEIEEANALRAQLGLAPLR